MLHSKSTNQESPVAVAKAHVAGRVRTCSSTEQASPRADPNQSKLNNSKRTDENKSGKIKDMAMKISDTSSSDCESPFSRNEEKESIVERDVESRLRRNNRELVLVRRKTLLDVNRNLSVLFQSLEKSPMYTRPNITKSKTRRTIDISQPSTSTAGLNDTEIQPPVGIDISEPTTNTAGLNDMEIQPPVGIDISEPTTNTAGLNDTEIQPPVGIDISEPTTNTAGLNDMEIQPPVGIDISEPTTNTAGLNDTEIQPPVGIDISEPTTSTAGRIIPPNESQDEKNDVNAGKFIVRLKKEFASKLLDSCRTRPGIPGRRYEHWEKIAILQYLIDHKCIHAVGGLRVWEDMIADNVLTHRTAGSLNNHFRKSLIHDISHYELPKKARKAFRELKQRMLKKTVDG